MSEFQLKTTAEGGSGRLNLKVLLLWVLAGLLGAGVAYKYFFVAFPEAALDLRISRAAALGVARDFLTAQGHRLDAYESSIVFRVDDKAKIYLEREVGLEQANRLMAGEVSVWHWEVRFFRPQQKEEFRVHVNPAGRVVGCTHLIEEGRAGARLEKEAALAQALAFLRDRVRADFGNYDFLNEEANSTERPARRDWSFTWERHSFKAKDAPYRLRVNLQGAEVGGFEEFLQVPEAWSRDYQRLRSSNILYQALGEVPAYFLLGAMLWMVYDLSRRGLVRWRGVVKLGLLVAALFFVKAANEWPLTRADYDTNSSYAGFFASQIAQAGLSSLLAGLFVGLSFIAAEPLYRLNQPGQLRLGVAFTLPGVRSREFFRSCVIGLAMAAAHLGFVVLFYMIGNRFGVWAPQEIKYTDVASTTLPWIYPLAIALFAATSEEFLFRLFAIPFLLRLTRSKFLAVVLPAFVWGFLHSAYPQQPGFIRGIEVGVIGVVAGLVMLRYGIVAALVWHYTVDALLIGLFLLRSGSLYFQVSGAVVGAGVLIPLALSGAFLVFRRRFEADELLLNRAQPLVETAPVAAIAAAKPNRGVYEALSPRALGIALGCGALGVLLLVAVKAEMIGEFVRFPVNARQAAAKADEVLRQRKVNPASYRLTATFVGTFDGYVNEYLRRQVGIAGANRLYQQKVPSAFWRIRYFRDSQKEEYAVILKTDGSLHSVHHQLEEKAPGATLSKEEAQARAQAYLCQEKKLDLTQWKLVEAASDKRPARTDHTFTWEELASVGEAHVRAQLKVLGEEVSGYRDFVKIPEEWERRQKEKTLASIIYTVGQVAFFGGLLVSVLVLFFKNLKQPAAVGVPWRRFAVWALWGLLAVAVLLVNSLPIVLSNYDTQIPLKSFAALLLIGLFLFAALVYMALFFLFGLAWFFLARWVETERLPAWRGMPAAYYRDAFCVALAGTGAMLGLARLPHLLTKYWPTAMKTFGTGVPSGLDTYFPAAVAIADAIRSGLFLAGLIGLAAGFLGGYLRQRWLRIALVVALAVALSSGWGSPSDFAKKVLVELVTLGVVWWGVTQVVKFNLLAYFLLGASLALCRAATELLRQPNDFFRANGYASVVALLLLLAWPLFVWLRGVPPGAVGAEEVSSPEPSA